MESVKNVVVTTEGMRAALAEMTFSRRPRPLTNSCLHSFILQKHTAFNSLRM